MSKNEKLARKITFGRVLPFFNCPFFLDYFPPQVDFDRMSSNVKRLPRELRFPKNILISAGTGSAESALGAATFGGTIDEANFLEVLEFSKRGGDKQVYDAAAEMHDTLRKRMHSRFSSGLHDMPQGLFAMISSSNSTEDYLEKQIQDAIIQKENSSTFWVRLPIWEVKPEGTYTKECFYFDTVILSVIDEEQWGKNCLACGNITDMAFTITIDGEKKHFCSIDCYKSYMMAKLGEADALEKDDYVVLKIPKGEVKKPTFILQEFVKDPIKSLCDYASMPRKSGSKFFKRWDFIDRCNDGRLNLLRDDGTFIKIPAADPNVRYYAHVDGGLSDDGFAIAIGHADKSIMYGPTPYPDITTDFMASLKPRRDEGEFQVQIKHIDELFDTLVHHNYDFALVTFDRFQSAATKQHLWHEHRIPVGDLSIDNTRTKPLVDPDSEEYGVRKESGLNDPNAALTCLRVLMHIACIHIPDYPLFYAEAKGLNVLIKGKSITLLKSKTPVVSLNGRLIVATTDDVVQAVAGMAFNIMNNELNKLPQDAKKEQQKDETVLHANTDNYSAGIETMRRGIGRLLTDHEFEHGRESDFDGEADEHGEYDTRIRNSNYF